MPATIQVSASDVLYAACSVTLLISAVAVAMRDPRSPQHRLYGMTSLALLGWVATLGLYYRSAAPADVLLLGRINFSAAALAIAFGYLLVRAIALDAAMKRTAGLVTAAVMAEALLLAAVTYATPLIDRAELLGVGGRHVTVYGSFFPLYAAHVVGFVAASTILAFTARSRQAARGPVRDRLTLVGLGVLATGLVGIVADIVLPYGFGDFRFTDWGPYSTALFLLAVGYAVLKHRLFDLRILIRKTLVYGVLGAMALAIYSAVVIIVTDRLAGDDTVAKFAVLVIALSFDPLRRVFERKVDDVLFGRDGRRIPSQAARGKLLQDAPGGASHDASL